jgi:hypothetical protein
MVTARLGQPPELAIRADIEVPERKLAVTFSFRRNTDKGLPATHTVKILFKLPADFPFGGISNVPGILMKQAESTRGAPLAGLAVRVTPGFYLIQPGGRQGAQSAAIEGARLGRHSGGLQQQPPRHSGGAKGHTRRARFRRCVRGLAAVKSCYARAVIQPSLRPGKLAGPAPPPQHPPRLPAIPALLKLRLGFLRCRRVSIAMDTWAVASGAMPESG